MSLAEDLRQFQSPFIDTAVVIYHIEAHPALGPVAREVVHTFRVGARRAYTPVMTLVEVLRRPVAAGNEALAEKFIHILAHTRNLELLGASAQIAERAGRLRAKYRGLKAADAIQLSAALCARAEAFVTNDVDLRRVDELRIIVPSDYM